MWPWEHAAFGYLLYSGGLHVWRRAGPGGPAALVLVLATQLPDVVDKPLSWLFGLFPSGFSVAHSIFVAVPLILAVIVATQQRRRPELGIAFAVGYGSHLVGDVVAPLRDGDSIELSRVLWPLVTQSPYDHDYGLVGRTVVYLEALVSTLGAADPIVLVLYLALPVAALLFWIADGRPGVATVHRWLRPSRRVD
jgi:membrane-bound metal-dependent hydrolase YbcI (DUF457 family)